ncbi:oocyte zinc finger protein XlCOF8.4-like [Astyanax mexicanus]|uniref:Oocyte zinc finger protein XlCOF8.4-like n=2 Tax=Astyanax mexicanus TaxID=7994 RepID=A0A8T2M5J5_ASTMX|nr:oocyte zinc finger protein XlCOF8.4-like [Astyanax mexicanus]
MEALGAMGCSGFDVELRALVDVLLKDVCALAVRWNAALQREITASRSENSELRRRLHIMEQTLSHSSHSTQAEAAGRVDTQAGLPEPGGNEGLKKAPAECAKKTVNIEIEPTGPTGGQWQRQISALPGLKEEEMDISITGKTQHRFYANGDVLHATDYTSAETDCQFPGLKTECERKAESEIQSPEANHSQDNSRDDEDDTLDGLAVEEACEPENHSTQHGHHYFSHKTEENEDDLEREDEEQEQFYTSHFMPPDLRLSSTLLPINSESTLSDCSMFASLEGNAEKSTHLLNAECSDLDSDPTNSRKPRGPRYICNICGKSLSSKYSLTVHFTMHTGERPYACAQCGKRFVNRSNLQIHQNIHTGAKPYVCTLCPKSFADPSPFGRHKRMHSRELQQSSRSPKCQFICNICGKSLSTKQGLSYHLTMHTGERPYSCTWCGKSFVLKHNLKIHQNIHTGAKPYACTLCPKSFADPSSLKKHQRMHES